MNEDPDGVQENDCERSRKAKDTKLVSFSRQINYLESMLLVGSNLVCRNCLVKSLKRRQCG